MLETAVPVLLGAPAGSKAVCNAGWHENASGGSLMAGMAAQAELSYWVGQPAGTKTLLLESIAGQLQISQLLT